MFLSKLYNLHAATLVIDLSPAQHLLDQVWNALDYTKHASNYVTFSITKF